MLSGKTFPFLAESQFERLAVESVVGGFFALSPEKTLLLVMLVNPSAYEDAISKFSVERKTSLKSVRGGVNLCRILLGCSWQNQSTVWEKKTCWNTRTSEESRWVRSEVPLDQHSAPTVAKGMPVGGPSYMINTGLFKKKKKASRIYEFNTSALYLKSILLLPKTLPLMR